MLTLLSQRQVEFYRENGYLVVEALLDGEELEKWRAALAEGVARHFSINARHNQGRSDHYEDVFVQCVNLWKTSEEIKQLVTDPRLGRLAAALAGVDSVRLYHDHALVKEPWAHPTNWHVDNAMDPFHSRQSIMLWVALDDATLQNGCMYFLPGTHRCSRFDVTGNLNETRIDGLLADYPEWRAIEPVAAEVQAGGAVFINGMTAHAAGPNMTVHPRRALAMLFMPAGAVYNGRPAALPAKVAAHLRVGDEIADNEHLPLIYPNS